MVPLVWRARVAACAWALVAAAAASALVAIGVTLAGGSLRSTRFAAIATLLAATAIASFLWTRRGTLARVAADLERRAGGLDNLIVTAAEAAEGRQRPLHPVVAAPLWQAATERLSSARPHAPAVAVPAILAALSLASALLVTWTLPRVPLRAGTRLTTTGPAGGAGGVLATGDLRVHVTPPAYTRREVSVAVNPDAISVLEGSQVRLDVSTAGEGVRLVHPGHGSVDLARAGDVWTHAFTADASRVLLLQPQTTDGRGARLLHVRVDPDRRPIVRIEAPARDLVMRDSSGQVPVHVVAEDDLALDDVALRYTRVAGSGETFTFEEGEAPLTIERATPTAWRARATLSLGSLKLEEGDTLVYRAIARDGKPGREPSVSDTFIVEIGRLAGAASAGFAVPRERDRQAISQQMVIIKTERLHAARATMAPNAFAEQTRLLAIEQRMVKAEFVFMTGGHVEDEVAEAEAGHELAEGRLENEAQVELLNAIREMSRAEARLNDTDTARALVFERAALRALQRAFDRRRYLLRTLPERTRIDPARRLTGERREARGQSDEGVPRAPDLVVAAARAALIELAAAAHTSGSLALVAARVVAVDPEHADLQRAAVALGAAVAAEDRRAAIDGVQRVLTAVILLRVGAAPRGNLSFDPLDGRVADVLRGGRP